jgi:hypothetical protein
LLPNAGTLQGRLSRFGSDSSLICDAILGRFITVRIWHFSEVA